MVICIFCKLLSIRYYFAKSESCNVQSSNSTCFFHFVVGNVKLYAISPVGDCDSWIIVLPTLTLAKLISEKIKILVKFLCLFYINVCNMIKLLVTVFIIKPFTRINVFIKVKLPWKQLFPHYQITLSFMMA